MVSEWRPQGYNSVSVYLVADGAQRVVDFLKKTFGATDLRRFEEPGGKIMHAEVRVGDTVVMIADSGGAYPAFRHGCMCTCPMSTRAIGGRSRREGFQCWSRCGKRAIRISVVE